MRKGVFNLGKNKSQKYEALFCWYVLPLIDHDLYAENPAIFFKN